MINSSPDPTPATDTSSSVAPLEAEPALADLAVEAGDEIKGGPLSDSGWGGSARLNHNESQTLDDSM